MPTSDNLPNALSDRPSGRELRRQLVMWGDAERAAMRRAAAVSVADGCLVIPFAWGLSRLVTALWDRPGDAGALTVPSIMVVLSMLLRAGLALWAQRVNAATAHRTVSRIRQDIMAKALAGRIDPQTQAAGLNSLFEDTDALEGYYARFYSADWQARSVPLLVLLTIATQSWVGALILAATLLPFLVLMALLGLSSASEADRQLAALSRLSNLLIDRVKNLPLILAFGDGDRQVATVGSAASEVAERTLRVLKIAFVTSGVLEFFSALAVALVAVYCGFYLLGELPFRSPEPLTLSTAFFVLALSPELYAPLRRLAAAYHDRQTAMAGATRLMAMAIQPPVAPAPPLKGAPQIVFHQVTITFADDPDFRIGPVSFVCAPGSVTCLSGPSGSGKTSLLRRVLHGGEGIEVAGRAVSRDCDLTSQIAYVSQSPPLIAGTLRDNLVLGNRQATPDELKRAIETFGLSEMVAARTDGLETLIDDRGSGLSGGEKRRIGLVRAWLRPAPILLLDEPGADLDDQAEAELLILLPRLFHGRTVLLTSHSARIMALADQVIPL